MIELIQAMLWPILATVLLPPLLVYLGLHTARREMIFLNLAFAQMAALGTWVAMALEHQGFWAAYAWSLGLTLLAAVVVAVMRNRTSEIPREALMGGMYAVSMAIGILLLNRGSEGDEELKRTVVGDLLLTNQISVLRTFATYLSIGAIHFLFRRQFVALSFAPEEATATEFGPPLWDFLFYCLYGVVVSSFVQIGGVLLTFSYLLVPAVCATLLAKGLGVRLIIGWIIASGSSILALYLSYKIDQPTSAVIVCVLSAFLLLTIIYTRFRRA